MRGETFNKKQRGGKLYLLSRNLFSSEKKGFTIEYSRLNKLPRGNKQCEDLERQLGMGERGEKTLRRPVDLRTDISVSFLKRVGRNVGWRDKERRVLTLLK